MTHPPAHPFRLTLYALLCLGFGTLPPILRAQSADEDKPLPPFANVPAYVRRADPAIDTEYKKLLADVSAFNTEAASFNAQCGSIDTRNTALIQSCTTRYSSLMANHNALLARIRAFASSASSATVVQVLTARQKELAEVDRKLADAEKALERLKGQNEESEQQLEEWTESSEEASNDAERLGIALLLDLAGEDVEDLTQLNQLQRSEALNAVLNRLNGADLVPHAVLKELIEESESLERAKTDVEAAGKLETLREKIEDLHKPVADPRFSQEEVLDMEMAVNKPLEDAMGPFRDLTDAAYTVYKQAVSLDRMAVIEKNQEQSLKAAEALRQTVKTLVARKRALEQSSAKQP